MDVITCRPGRRVDVRGTRNNVGDAFTGLYVRQGRFLSRCGDDGGPAGKLIYARFAGDCYVDPVATVSVDERERADGVGRGSGYRADTCDQHEQKGSQN